MRIYLDNHINLKDRRGEPSIKDTPIQSDGISKNHKIDIKGVPVTRSTDIICQLYCVVRFK
jgi:hypothetical protein